MSELSGTIPKMTILRGSMRWLKFGRGQPASWCYHHVQAIIVPEAALGHRDFFLNKPYSIGGSMNEHTR